MLFGQDRASKGLDPLLMREGTRGGGDGALCVPTGILTGLYTQRKRGVFQISGLHNTNRSSSMSKACLTPYRGRRMSSTADAVAFWSARLAQSARTLGCADFCGSKRPAGQARTPEDGYSPPKGCNELTQKVEIHNGSDCEAVVLLTNRTGHVIVGARQDRMSITMMFQEAGPMRTFRPRPLLESGL
jgi:hypothetical protein